MKFLGNLINRFSESNKRKRQKEILLTMLSNERLKWRKLETLANAIGESPEETVTLLLEIRARASENGSGVWGLISRNPLNDQVA